MDYITIMTISPPFQVRTAGLIERQPYHSTPGTRQGDIMLTVFLDGNGVYRNSRGSVYVHGSMAGLVPPDDMGVLAADPQDPYIHYYCRFSGEYARELAARILERHPGRFFPITNAEETAEFIRRMGRYSSLELPGIMGRREALLAQALTALVNPSQSEGRPPLTAASIEEYLRDHIADPTSLPRMADHFMVSRTTLCRHAVAACGGSIQRLHQRMKLEWARTLLASGRYNVAQTARRVGYGDPLYFSRVFKKCTGMSPRNWRVNSKE
jgi:AraC-like DNA-binding protein